MFAKLFMPEATGRFQLPLGAYYITRAAHALAPIFLWLSALETRWVRARTEMPIIDRPVYICGLARSGTTIVLEMLSQHPDAGSHRYIHAPVPYLPCWWGGVASKRRRVPPPVERMHKDGIMVSRYSPEAVEEPLWVTFFDGLHDEECSHILDGHISNEAFEAFYRDHIRKLLLGQGRSRYVAKNNYLVSRTEYLLRVFPDARFLVMIRNPVNHIASMLRQNRIFEEVERTNPRTAKMIQLIGHYEFGNHRICINVGDTDLVHKIRRLWSSNNHIQAWATYWASVYQFIADRLRMNPALASNTLVVRHEDLVSNSSATLDQIITHAQLPADAFRPIRDRYVSKLSERKYYDENFSEQELMDIVNITGPTAARFGYPDGLGV